MFNESKTFNFKKPKIKEESFVDGRNEVLQSYKNGSGNEILDLINEDCPGSQLIASLSESEKVDLFFEKYQAGLLEYFETANFNYLKSLNYNDRRLAKGVMFTNKCPRECIRKYHREFPEDRAIEDIGLGLFSSLEDYSWEDDARIDNQGYDAAWGKLSEMDLFLDKNLRLLKNEPENFKSFLEQFKLFTLGIRKDAKKLIKVINNSLFEKSLDFSEVFSVIISRAELKLLALEQELKTGANHQETLARFSKSLALDNQNRSQNITELGEIADQLNLQYQGFNGDVSSGVANLYDHDPENIDEEKLSALISGYDLTSQDLIMDDFLEHKKFSAERLKELIENYQDLADGEAYNPAAMRQVSADFDEEEKRLGSGKVENFSWSDRIKEYNQKFPSPKTEEQLIYEEVIKKIKQALPLQIALEKKIDQLIYGREEVILSADFNNFEKSLVVPERIPEQAPLYFPVGISKDLNSWQAVFEGEKKFVKPIDLYGYLFWLNNQKQTVNLIICDEIQTSNYVKRYGLSESAAREAALKIGQQETLVYQKIIETFGLNNIKLQNYQEFLSADQEKYRYYSSLVKNLAVQPVFKEIFLSMVQDSVSGAEKEEYIAYALEELSWILSTNGTKIGHLNEARYDILASVIRSLEQVAKDKNIDIINNLGSSEAKSALTTICRSLRDVINEKKSKLDKASFAAAYFQRLQEHLNKIKIDPAIISDKTIKKDSLSLNFVCPEVGSASFGFRMGAEEKESVIKFKEPYSTYFYKNDSDLLINSDQVVASGTGLIGGKVLTLDNKKQEQYAKNVVWPILNHYFNCLKTAPEEYFEKISKSREELLNEAKEATSLLASLRFIQKYIVKPTELA